MKLAVKPLPYTVDALEPHLSAEAISIHHAGHYKAYVDAFNRIAESEGIEDPNIENLIRGGPEGGAGARVFDLAAQIWNHEFFWDSMKQGGGGMPPNELLGRIESDIGPYETFREAFLQAAIGQFASGWIWLVSDRNALRITTTSNAMTPLAQSQIPILCCDLWEHAYYVDYRNRRRDFVETFLSSLANWDFAALNLWAITRQQAAPPVLI